MVEIDIEQNWAYVYSDYNIELVEHIKGYPSTLRSWNKETKEWEIHLSLVEYLVDFLVDNDIKHEMFGDVADSEILEDCDFKLPPLPWQSEAVVYGMKHNKWILADSMGLGKTLSSLKVAEERKKAFNYKYCLVICGINGSKWNWLNEVNKFTYQKGTVLGSTKLRNGKVIVKSNDDKLNELKRLHGGKNDIYYIITNIESLRYAKKVPNILKSGKVSATKPTKDVYPLTDLLVEMCNSGEIGCIILDESHKAKSTKSIQTKQLLRLKADSQMALSGTPLLNKPTELWSTLNWLDIEKHSEYSFIEHYSIKGDWNKIVGYKNLEELRQILSGCMLRRTKKLLVEQGYLPDKLPPITEYVEMDKEQQKIYNEVMESIRKDVDKIKLSPNPLASTIRLRQATADTSILSTKVHKSAKLDRLEELVADITENGDKVLIFSNWEEVTKRVRERLKDYNHIYITGKVKDEDVEKEKKRFMTDEKCSVAIGTIGKMGTSHNLQSASYVIFLDLPWTYGDKEQAEDRANRIGSKKALTIIELVCKNTIDEKIQEIVNVKKDLSDMLVDGKTSKRAEMDIFMSVMEDELDERKG